MNYMIVFMHLWLLTFVSLQAQNAKIRIEFSGINQIKGEMMIALYNNGNGFPGNGALAYQTKSFAITNTNPIVEFNSIPYGTYAVAYYQDLNSNRKLDTNWLGIPTEPYGFSNNVTATFAPPDFKAAAFEVKTEVVTLKLKL
jgi:uncharacterized protein (DUF2141 family)